MAALYGSLSNGRSESTKTGTKNSGIQAQLQTWEGAVRVRLEHDGHCVVETGDPRKGRWQVAWIGDVGDHDGETRPMPSSDARSEAHR